MPPTESLWATAGGLLDGTLRDVREQGTNLDVGLAARGCLEPWLLRVDTSDMDRPAWPPYGPTSKPARRRLLLVRWLLVMLIIAAAAFAAWSLISSEMGKDCLVEFCAHGANAGDA